MNERSVFDMEKYIAELEITNAELQIQNSIQRDQNKLLSAALASEFELQSKVEERDAEIAGLKETIRYIADVSHASLKETKPQGPVASFTVLALAMSNIHKQAEQALSTPTGNQILNELKSLRAIAELAEKYMAFGNPHITEALKAWEEAKAKQFDDRFKAACDLNREIEEEREKFEAEIARLKERILAIKNVNNSVPAALMEGGEQMNDKTPEPTCRTVTLWACPRCGHEYESREEAKRCCWSYYNPSTIYVLSRSKSRAMYQEDSK